MRANFPGLSWREELPLKLSVKQSKGVTLQTLKRVAKPFKLMLCQKTRVCMFLGCPDGKHWKQHFLDWGVIQIL